MKKNNFSTRDNRRNAGGNSIAELPPVLIVLFFMFVFPLINLGTVALRWALLCTASRDGAHAAATSYTFETGSPGKPAALQTSPSAVNQLVGKYTGIHVTNIDVDILATDVTSQAVTRHANKLTNPANTQNNIYAIETIVTADLDPLMLYNLNWIVNVPGLTAPWRATVRAREFAESPQGLNQ